MLAEFAQLRAGQGLWVCCCQSQVAGKCMKDAEAAGNAELYRKLVLRRPLLLVLLETSEARRCGGGAGRLGLGERSRKSPT